MKFTHQPGATPVDGFTIRRGIHRGGFGEVYYAISDGGKEVALKLLQHEQEVELRGVRQCLNLKHPNLVNLFDVKTDSHGEQWVVMEYVGGTSLEDVLSAFPNGMALDEVRDWMAGLVAGVSHLHDRGIVHRDLKPANVYREAGVVKVGDVGLSKRLGSDRRGAHTQSVGTVYYMAPEVGRGQYGPEVDVYSLGIMLYEMLTGHVPFCGETTGEILMKHLTAQPDLSVLQERFRPVLAHALEKDPAQRTPTVKQLGDEFLSALEGRSTAFAMTNEAATGGNAIPVTSPSRPKGHPTGFASATAFVPPTPPPVPSARNGQIPSFPVRQPASVPSPSTVARDNIVSQPEMTAEGQRAVAATFGAGIALACAIPLVLIVLGPPSLSGPQVIGPMIIFVATAIGGFWGVLRQQIFDQRSPSPRTDQSPSQTTVYTHVAILLFAGSLIWCIGETTSQLPSGQSKLHQIPWASLIIAAVSGLFVWWNRHRIQPKSWGPFDDSTVAARSTLAVPATVAKEGLSVDQSYERTRTLFDPVPSGSANAATNENSRRKLGETLRSSQRIVSWVIVLILGLILFSPGTPKAWAGLGLLGLAVTAALLTRYPLDAAGQAELDLANARTADKTPVQQALNRPVAVDRRSISEPLRLGWRGLLSRESMQEVSFSVSLSALCACLLTTGGLFALEFFRPDVGQASTIRRADILTLFFATLIGSAWILIAARQLATHFVVCHQHPRLTMLAAALLAGSLGFGLDEFLRIDFPRSVQTGSMFQSLGVHPLTEGRVNPTWLGYVVFFCGLFSCRNWGRDMVPDRPMRLSLGKLFQAGILGFLVTAVFEFPSLLAVPWAVLLSATVQLACPWVGSQQRSSLVRS